MVPVTGPEPAVSLIVLNLDGRRHLEAGLESLEALDYPASKLQLIVFDNGSGDGSVEYVRERHPRVEVLHSPTNLGFAEANNRAAKVATGEWLGFLNNDMRVDPSWLRALLGALDRCPDAAALGSRILSWDGERIDFVGGGVNYQGHGHQVDFGTPVSASAEEPRRLLFACGGAMLVRRSVFLELEGFDPSFFAYFEDIDLGWRLNLLGHDVWYVPAATAYHHHHSTGARFEPHRLRVLYERNALATIYKCLDDANLAAALPAALLLLNERALLIGQADPERFRLGAPAAAAGGPPPAVERAKPLARAVRVMRSEGVAGLLARTVRYMGRQLAGMSEPGGPALSNPLALSHYVALSEFTNSLDELTAKRAAIQATRVRDDAEVLALAGDMLYPNFNDPSYLEFYEFLNQTEGLDVRFGSREAPV